MKGSAPDRIRGYRRTFRSRIDAPTELITGERVFRTEAHGPVDQHPEWVAGIPVNAVTRATAAEAILIRIRDPRPGAYVCLSNAHTVVESRRSRELRSAVRGAFLSVPDGKPLVWLLRRRGFPNTQKVTGVDFMPLLFHAGREEGVRHFLYGGAPGVAEAAGRRLAAQTGAHVVGSGAPPFSPMEQWPVEDLEEEIVRKRPDILWVGLGAPLQEIWMARVADRLKVPVMVGVGAAFDFISGTKSAAPNWMSEAGMEWLYRLMSEPRRLWRRYLIGNPHFIYLLARERLTRRGGGE